MVGIYLSGTGNTEHCVTKLVKMLDASAQCFPLEHRDIVQILKNHDTIVLGYPTQFSNAPIMVRDFIKNNASLRNGKKVRLSIKPEVGLFIQSEVFCVIPWDFSAATGQGVLHGF